ncbi:unnamed protein product [Lactuca virosa]|uniref:Uncharacterized protein n=1 Tax=Lactuca virosa TaxID=75947 RepID=A0AAU9NRI0_9ASTR|nr:unnamed protein product [Lactuca virosa]
MLTFVGVMKDGLAKVIGHVLESLEFIYGVKKFRKAYVAAGNALKVEEANKLIDGGSDLVVNDGLDHETIVEEALNAFSSLDYISALGLKGLDMGKLIHKAELRGGASSS